MRSALTVQQALKRDGRRCCNCGAAADHAHHIVPLSLGGLDVLSNLVSLCGSCHGAVHGLDLTHHRQLTRAGMAAAKARGVKFGGLRPNTMTENTRAKAAAVERSELLRPILAPMAARGESLRAMAEALAGLGITTRKGKALSPSSVKNHLQRLALLGKPPTPSIHA